MSRMMLPERFGTKNMAILRLYSTREETGGAICPTITGDHNARTNDYMAIVVEHETVQSNESDGVC